MQFYANANRSNVEMTRCTLVFYVTGSLLDHVSRCVCRVEAVEETPTFDPAPYDAAIDAAQAELGEAETKLTVLEDKVL